MAAFITYYPAIGRWLQVDPLAEIMPSMTPYRFGFNNPILWSDPSGLFESRKKARQFKRANGLRGRTRRTSKDKNGNKTFAFTDKGSGTEYTYGAGSAGNFGGQEALAFPSGTIKPYQPNGWEKMSQGDLGSRLVYNVINDVSLVLQTMNPLQTSTTHLSGNYASQSEGQDALTATAMTFIPIGRATTSTRAISPLATQITPVANGFGAGLKAATGGTKQWVRLAPSYSHHLSMKTRMSLKWGAGAKHWKKIGNPTLQSLNRKFRQTRIPLPGKRFADPGHFHIIY
jgi:hypothetical protein